LLSDIAGCIARLLSGETNISNASSAEINFNCRRAMGVGFVELNLLISGRKFKYLNEQRV